MNLFLKHVEVFINGLDTNFNSFRNPYRILTEWYCNSFILVIYNIEYMKIIFNAAVQWFQWFPDLSCKYVEW